METYTWRGPSWTGAARRSLGICLLLLVVVLWTASNFLASVCASREETFEMILLDAVHLELRYGYYYTRANCPLLSP